MNRLAHPDGGMPFQGEDIDWMQDAMLEGIKGISYPFVKKYSGNCILSGCDISYSGGSATITEGYVMIDFEVCYCAAQTVAVTSLAASSLKVSSSYDPEGLEVFADNVSRDTYEVRIAVISDGLNSGAEIILENPPRIYAEYDLTPYLQGNWVAQTTDIVAIRLGNQIQFKGSVYLGDTNTPVFTLPTFLRPSQNAYYILPGVEFSVSSIITKVGSDGSVFPVTDGGQLTFTLGSQLGLDSILYTI